MTPSEEVAAIQARERTRLNLLWFAFVVLVVVSVLWAIPREQRDLNERTSAALDHAGLRELVDEITFDGRDGTLRGPSLSPDRRWTIEQVAEAVDGVRVARFIASRPADAPVIATPAPTAAPPAAAPVPVAPAPVAAAKPEPAPATVKPTPAPAPAPAVSTETTRPAAQSPAPPAKAGTQNTDSTTLPADAALAMRWDGDRLALRATLAHPALANRVLSPARAIFGTDAVDPSISVSDSAASGWEGAISVLLRALRELHTGSLVLRGDTVELRGRAAETAAREAALARLGRLARGFLITTDISVKPLLPAQIAATVAGGQLTLNGTVGSQRDRQVTETVARAVLGATRVQSQVDVDRDIAALDANVRFAAALSRLQFLSDFALYMIGDETLVEGSVDTLAEADSLSRLLTQVLAPGTTRVDLKPRARSAEEVQSLIDERIGSVLLFPEYSTEIGAGMGHQIEWITDILASYPGLTVTLEYIDAPSADGARRARARAEAVQTALTATGIDGTRIGLRATAAPEPVAARHAERYVQLLVSETP
ncbi:MAG: hypothetical protein KDG50_13465 [Chromatiales bacterium]|nr:hypothetical protein [Chromatiales bacterium]